MRSSLVRSAITFLIAQSLLTTTVFSQQQTNEQSRPRRVQTEWPQTPNTTPIIPTPVITSISGPEPKIRVALTTNARSAVISTTGHLLKSTGDTSSLLALEIQRVRVEPHLLGPPPTNQEETFIVTVSGSASREEAAENAKEIKKLTSEESQVTLDPETKTWGLVVGSKQPREEAEELVARLEAAGIDASLSGNANAIGASTQAKQTSENSSSKPGIKLTSKVISPSREVVASSTTNARLFSSSAPVAFASDDEKSAPVRYNDKPFRGRIEVFTNLRGSLTVVNELGLEDYVRGVVANELSPGGYPAIEALKAQAIAARTYALKNRGQFMSQGFDILPTTRSQVYRGLTSEHPLSTRAVDETRGLIATYAGEPINALYTSTCGGRTENAENIFNHAVAYLRGVECSAERARAFTTFMVKTSREPAEIRSEGNLPLARDIALLAIQSVSVLPSQISDTWLNGHTGESEARTWIAHAARIARQAAPPITDDTDEPGPFATALLTAVLGDSRTSTLLNDVDADYFLAVRDLQGVPTANRSDLALLVRDGHLAVYPDATIRPGESLTRAKALHAIASVLEKRNLLQLQKATARPTADGQLILRSTKGKDQPIKINSNAFLFRQIGEGIYATRSIPLVGGEAVTFHVGADGTIDYLEVKPSMNGAAADRSSPFNSWTKELSPGQVQSRLARYSRGIGQLLDLRVVARGSSRRVTDLEIVGTNGTAHVRGGRIRSVLGLREQLFVIDRHYDENGRVSEFIFNGRGWGHGVGMCQVGAYGLAKQGLSYEQILKTYYTGIELTKMY